MTTAMEPFAALAQRATENSHRAHQHHRLQELVSLIDELSGEMGSAAFRDVVRLHGYDIDACAATLGRRGVSIN